MAGGNVVREVKVRLSLEDAFSGPARSGVLKTLSDIKGFTGAGSGAGMVGAALKGGGAFIALKLLGEAARHTGDEFASLAETMHAGDKSGIEMARSITEIIPITGSVTSGLNRMFDGTADLVAETAKLVGVNEDYADTWLSVPTRIKRAKEAIEELTAMRGFLGQSTGIRDSAQGRTMMARAGSPEEEENVRLRLKENTDGATIKRLRDEQHDLELKGNLATPQEKARLSYLANNTDVDERALKTANEAERQRADRDRMNKASDDAYDAHKDMIKREREGAGQRLQDELGNLQEAARMTKDRMGSLGDPARFASGDFSIGSGIIGAIREAQQNNPQVRIAQQTLTYIQQLVRTNEDMLREIRRQSGSGDSLFGELN